MTTLGTSDPEIDNRQSTIDNSVNRPLSLSSVVPTVTPFTSRGGDKLEAALQHFAVEVAGRTCADLGSHVGGFVDCLLRSGAARVYSVDTAYGILAWKLRRDPRVTVLERTNAMHVTLPETVELVTVDVGWTPQSKILPNVTGMLSPAARVITLIKPHYEAAENLLVNGVLPDERVDGVVGTVLDDVKSLGWAVLGTFPSPLRGHAGNREVFALLTRSQSEHA
jgi:23S rRNA (cytidine1920-2'-O)/16S rRNA (cytidine1409-2'-O)-methyltransferase